MSQGHARHAWVCRQCRKLIRGNGGKSSHRAWHEKRGDPAELIAAHMPEAKALLACAATPAEPPAAASREPRCPGCGGPVKPTGPGPGWMNAEQWDAEKAGDWYCEACSKNGRGRTGFAYWTDAEVRAIRAEPVPEEPRVSTCIARDADGRWWTVTMHDGEPHHAEHHAGEALYTVFRDSFGRWCADGREAEAMEEAEARVAALEAERDQQLPVLRSQLERVRAERNWTEAKLASVLDERDAARTEAATQKARADALEARWSAEVEHANKWHREAATQRHGREEAERLLAQAPREPLVPNAEGYWWRMWPNGPAPVRVAHQGSLGLRWWPSTCEIREVEDDGMWLGRCPEPTAISPDPTPPAVQQPQDERRVVEEVGWAWCAACRGVVRGRCLCVKHQDFTDDSRCPAHRDGGCSVPCKCATPAEDPRDAKADGEHDATR